MKDFNASARHGDSTVEAIRRWMRAHADEYRDLTTGEINTTELVEAWDRACASGGTTLNPDHPAWDVAAKIS